MPKSHINRIYISYFLVVVIILGFFLRLVQFQIVDGQKYSSIAERSLSYRTTMEATRGEILDRNGNPIATSRMSFNIEFNRAFLPKNKDNETILKVSEILLQKNIPWNDSLFINYQNNEWSFIEDKTEEIAKLKKDLKLNGYATAENVMFNLIEKYELQNYNKKEQRIIAGVKHQMNLQSFSNATPYIFANDIPLDIVTIIKENSLDLRGVDINVTPVREYVDQSLAPHIIGVTGPITAEDYKKLKESGYSYNDIVGQSGIEKLYESTLRGTDGIREVVRNENGDIVDIATTKEPIPGKNVSLTIDINLQKTTQNLLQQYIKKFNTERKEGDGKDADSGAAVVVNVKTGEVLAMASYPSYNIDTYKDSYSSLLNDPTKPLFNRALQGIYNPGSIYKPIMGIVGSEAGFIDENYTVNCTQVYNRFSDYKPRCLGHHGKINLYNAMAVSCNIYFYEVGYLAGIDKINEISKDLGAGSRTGIELSENEGQIASPELRKQKGGIWQQGDIVQAAIGQSDTMITPLQMAVYTAAIANNGVRNKVTIIKDVKDYNGNVIEPQKEPSVMNSRQYNQKSFDLVKHSMLTNTISGSGRVAFRNFPFNVGTKTGTPQSPTGSNNGSFVAFGPYEEPEIAVAAIIEHAGEGYYIAPMVRDIFDAYFNGKYVLS